MARPSAPHPDTRTRILAAACDEFGAHGFAATTVDRIARRARVNKAMIYYHFPNKRALYTCIIRDVFAPIAERVRAAIAEDAPPDRKLARVIDTLVRSVDASTYFLPIFLREIADGGAHLGPEELALLAGIFATVSGIVVDGRDSRRSSARSIRPWRISRSSGRSSCSAPPRRSGRGSRACGTSTFPMPIPTRSCVICRWSRSGCWRLRPADGDRAEGKGQRAEGRGQRDRREPI